MEKIASQLNDFTQLEISFTHLYFFKIVEMKKILTICFNTLLAGMLFGQQVPNLWKQVQYNEIFLPEKSETIDMPTNFITYSLDLDALRNHLRDAPLEGSQEAKAGVLRVQLPMENGEMETFRVWETSVMHPDLAAKYPMIKTFAGKGLDHPSYTVRLGFGLDGFHAIIKNHSGGVAISPYATNQVKYYACTNVTELLKSSLDLVNCGHVNAANTEDQPIDDSSSPSDHDEVQLRGGGEGANAKLRIYFYALSCTGEYAQLYGSDKDQVMSAFVTSTNLLNSVLEPELGIRLVLVPDNDLLIFLDPDNDPYNQVGDATALGDQNVNTVNQIIGEMNYDIGHLFVRTPCELPNGVGIGGQSQGRFCTPNRAANYSCTGNSNIVSFTLNTATHEMAHALTASHSFNNCPGVYNFAVVSAAGWEPGSGSTIMSYQGACPGGGQPPPIPPNNNIPGPGGFYYHSGNINQMWNFITQGAGSACPSTIETGNRTPIVELDYENGFYIPIGTPFELEATASDEDGDPLTYCWEQIDTDNPAQLGQPTGESPLFRSFDPNPSPVRYFPNLSSILNNTSDITEVLPSYSRIMSFRVAVRDNNIDEGAGGITWEDVIFNATNTAGPFLVTYPNTGAEKWVAGEEVEVTWEVANTDNDIVNCKAVDIWLSSDGGNTFDYLVVSNSPNDGSEIFTVPDYVGTDIRLKIKGSNNIFFDVSNFNFEIKAADEPGFSMVIGPQFQTSCLPANNLVELDVNPILGFDQPVELEVVEGLPPNAIVNFSTNPVMPGASTTLDFDLNDVTETGVFEVILRAVSGMDTTYRSIFLDAVYNDFSDLVLEGPVNGGSGYGLLPTFTWTDLPQADRYDFQLSTTPHFEPDDIIDEINDVTSTSYTPNFALEENSIYYWRVLPHNRCGKGEFSLKSVFQTFNSECTSKKSTDVPVSISGTGLPVIESVITVLESGFISDVNIKDLKGTHDALPDLRVTLISPDETKVILFEEICGNVSNFELDLNDESPFDIECPPLNGLAYKPQEPLANFKDENTLGNWTLEVAVINTAGQGGSLQGWTLEFCASITPDHPFLLENDTIYVKPNDTRTIHHSELWAADPDDATTDLRVNILDETKFGYISKNGVQLGVGDFFKFTDIYNGFVTYTNTEPDAESDFFTFTITDGHGGLFGTPKFNIVIDENAITGVDDLGYENTIALYPNPAADLLNIHFITPLTSDADIFISEVQGRVVLQQQVSQTELAQIDLHDLADGIYFLTVQTKSGVVTEKFVVQH